MFEEVADGVLAVSNRFVDGKAALVVGTDSVLAVDACNHPDEAAAMVAEVRRRGRRVDRLLYTHGHGDHVLGGGEFREAVGFAHPAAVDRMRATASQVAARTGQPPDQVTHQLRWPQVLADSEIELDLGGKHVRMLPTPGHTADSVCAYLVEDRVLVGGDTVVTGIVPSITEGDSRHLEATLHTLLELDLAVLIPGHGPVLRGAGPIRDWLRWEADYLRTVRELVAAHGPAGGAELLRTSKVEDHLAGRLAPDRHQLPERHRRVIRAILAELFPPAEPPPA